MIVHWVSDKGWVSHIIRTLSASKWSHVAIQIDTVVYEATIRNGVVRTSLCDFRKRYPVSDTFHVFGKKEIAKKWLDKQVGAPYDFGGLVTFHVNRNWEKPDKWFCSELVAEALIKAGIIHQKVRSHRITPRDLWVLLEYGDVDHE